MSQLPPSAQELRAGPKASVGQLFAYLRPHRRVLVQVGLLSFVGAALTLAQPALVRVVLDRIGAGEVIRLIVVALVVITLVDALVGALTQYLLLQTALRVVLDARKGLTAHLLRLPIPTFDTTRTGDLISRVGADTTLLQTAVTGGFVQAASSSVVAVGAVIAMALVDTTLLLVTLSVVAVSSAITISTARKVRRLTRETQARVGEMTSAVERSLSGVRTIRANRAEVAETTRIAADATRAYDAGLAAARLQAMLSPVSSVAAQTAFLGVLAIGGARVARGELAVSDLIAFVLYLFLLVRPLAQAVSAWLQIQGGLAAIHRINDVTSIPIEGADDPLVAPPDVVDAPRLVFEGVSFAFGDGHVVLDGVDFSIPRGARVALVGPSGAGKSTLLTLVERFRDPTGGRILLDGVALTDMPRESLRRRIGYVEQESPVLAGTLRENLLLGDETADDARLFEVLARVRLTELTTRSSDGLDVQVGERGLKLSGGERQRLAIARVLLAAPEVLLLDEPTSNLDAGNEEALKTAIEEVASDRTLLIVAHRLSTVADSDMIVVLDHGRVRATGTHEELIESDDLYRALATTQLLVPDA